MNQYITGQVIKKHREKNNMTQQMLADELSVSSKTISKWETGSGFPDVSILDDLAKALRISVAELFSGDVQENKNIHSNMLLTGFYICPICGNVITSVGDTFVSCHGITLPKEEAIEKDIKIDLVEDEYYIQLDSPMTKKDYVSFVCGVSSERIELVKMYPEGSSSVRLKRRGVKKIYYYDKREGLFISKVNIK